MFRYVWWAFLSLADVYSALVMVAGLRRGKTCHQIRKPTRIKFLGSAYFDGRSVRFILTGGNEADCTQALPLLAGTRYNLAYLDRYEMKEFFAWQISVILYLIGQSLATSASSVQIEWATS